MLQAGKSLMYSKGYRPLGQDKHKAVIEFIETVLDKKVPEDIIFSFNKLRKKRHRVIYEEADMTSESEAMSAIKISEEFVHKIKEILNIRDDIMPEIIILVDKNDKEIGHEEKIRAHENGGKLHRAFSIFIFNKKDEMLLQLRGKKKYHFGGLWTNACCSHPNKGETLEKAVHRKLNQEFGFDTDLKEILSFVYRAEFSNGLTEHEFDHVFIGKFDAKPKPNPEEIDDYKWVDVDWLKKDVVKHPENYTPWFKIILERVLEYMKNKNS